MCSRVIRHLYNLRGDPPDKSSTRLKISILKVGTGWRGGMRAPDTGQQARQAVVAMDPERSEEGLTWA